MAQTLARKRDTLSKRARIVQAIRAFFIDAGFLEVTTPHRIPVNAPETHIDPEPSGTWQLHTSPELCMKRLLAAGFERIFQICPCWRAQERGRRHLPEFTLLEWYRLDSDYRSLMADCEALMRHLVPEGSLVWQGATIDMGSPWERLTVDEAFHRYAGIGVRQALEEDRFEEVLVDRVEPHLGQVRPTILYDYPVELGALARRKPEQPDLAERFELYIGGLELANGFSELTDPLEQCRRFEADIAARTALGKPAAGLPEPFLNELGAIPAAAGIALGIDRLVMLLLDIDDIAEVVAFTPEEL
ncbi:MAG: EF-P lysine aminoacylase GenX [Deltaproteobacteria bacterium]|nr:MAG: EF-P lysine aminoacylase GenX [Deltaproteobacteria bacterium]